jgi:acid phosphatase (class A)
MKLSTDKTPELAVLVSYIITDASNATRKAKNHFNRLRPFLYFNEGTLIPAEEESHHTPSYPSSHSATGWTVALVLTELLPERAELILKAGYEYGQSRVIAGYHWQSDVDAGRLAASVLYAKLQGNERFREQLAKARQEFAKKRNASISQVSETISNGRPTSTKAYTINGTPASSRERGIIIQNNRKMIRK